MNAAISNHPYEVTAEMIEPGQANFIARDALLQFLQEYGEVALRIAEQLSRNYYAAYDEIRTLGLASSPAEKFAKFLLSLDVAYHVKTSIFEQLPLPLRSAFCFCAG